MKRILVAAVFCLCSLGLAYGEDAEAKFRELLHEDDELSARAEEGMDAQVKAQLRQLDAKYREFLRDHPKHAQAMVAYGSFLYDQRHEEQAVQWWKKAIGADPKCAKAYNDLAAHYGHSGRAGDALRYHQKAIDLDPNDPIYRFNWANTCFMYRKDAHAVYGWDTDETFRRSLQQFRKARDLAPQEYEYSRAYAESFYIVAKPDWQEALAAWEFCLGQPLDEFTRQKVYTHLARVCLRLERNDDARKWLGKVTLTELQGLRQVLERRLKPGDSTAAPNPPAGVSAGEAPPSSR